MLVMTLGKYARRKAPLVLTAIASANQFGSLAIAPYSPMAVAQSALVNVNQFGSNAIALVPAPRSIEITAIANVNQFGAHEIGGGESVPPAIAQTTPMNDNQFGAQEIELVPPPNSAAVFVNAGSRGSQGFGSSVSPGLPSSRITGNLLIGVVAAAVAGGSRTFSWPAGWNVIDDNTSTGTNASVAWRVVDGTESSVTVTWTGGNTSADAHIYQYSGNLSSGPIGDHDKNVVNTGSTTWSAPSIDTVAANSHVVAIIVGNTSTAPTQPSGWSIEASGDNGQATTYVVAKDVASPGSSGAISTSKGNTAYATFVFEIRAN